VPTPKRSLSQNFLSDSRILGRIADAVGTLRAVAAVVFVLAAGTSCTPDPLGFPEPSWGGAPAPRAEEVVEITFEHRWCDGRICTSDIVILHQLGGAHRAFYTNRIHDSTRLSSIDSLTFVAAAGSLRDARFFDRHVDRVGRGTRRTESWVVSAATCCRRKVREYIWGGGREIRHPLARPPAELDAIVRRLRWKVPVGML
jgi:hypothetical protein